MTDKRIPDDIVVTQVNLDEPGAPNGDDVIAEAEGDIHWQGTVKRLTLRLGTALLQLTYDTEDEESATHAAILIASATHGLPLIDAAELESDGISEDDELTPDDEGFLLSIVDDPHSDYNDELCGWPNYDTNEVDVHGRPVLKVTFQSDGGQDGDDPVETIEGRWALEFIEGGKRIVIMNETHHWRENNDGHAMAEAIQRNATKSKGGQARRLAITNAYDPSEKSVKAEEVADDD